MFNKLIQNIFFLVHKLLWAGTSVSCRGVQYLKKKKTLKLLQSLQRPDSNYSYQTPDSHISQKGELQRSCGWFVHGRMLLYAALSLLRVSFLARLCKSLKTLQKVQLWSKITISFQSHQLLIKATFLAQSCYMHYNTSHLHHCKVACLKKV